jgi:hypothetical protein
MEQFPLLKTKASLLKISPRSEGGHDIGTKARCQCGSEFFWPNLIQEVGSIAGGHWIVQCVECKAVHTLPYKIWDVAKV